MVVVERRARVGVRGQGRGGVLRPRGRIVWGTRHAVRGRGQGRGGGGGGSGGEQHARGLVCSSSVGSGENFRSSLGSRGSRCRQFREGRGGSSHRWAWQRCECVGAGRGPRRWPFARVGHPVLVWEKRRKLAMSRAGWCGTPRQSTRVIANRPSQRRTVWQGASALTHAPSKRAAARAALKETVSRVQDAKPPQHRTVATIKETFSFSRLATFVAISV
jgi:hypothetical protein